MKIFKYIPILAFATLLSACDEHQESGNATVGFSQAGMEVKENAGTIKIPFKFEGNASSYPISFDVDIIPQGDFDVEEAVHITQSKGLRYMGDPSVPVYLECQIINDDVINDPKVLTMQISNVKGASIAEYDEFILTIDDNDNNPYDQLCGDWIFSATSASTGKTEKFQVKILGGFTPEEESENYEKVLVCWGFNGYMDDLTGNEYGIKPLHSPVWYLDYDAKEKALYIQTETLMAGNFKNKATDDYVEIKTSTAIPNDKGFFYTDPDIRLKGTWSDDMKTISFNAPDQKGYGLACLIYTSQTSLPSYWSIHTSITLTQKK